MKLFKGLKTMIKNNKLIVNPLQWLWFLPIIYLATLLSACTNNGITQSTYEPDSDEVSLVDWEESYPAQYADWADSVHGEAYLSGDTNAPTCNDCHDSPKEGVIVNTATFHLEIPSRCARCHNDDSLMEQYDIATDVYETYLADFHGTTINYYAQTDQTAIRDEAVCSDCHGSHAIYPQEDERSSVAKVNLQATCAQCHPNATESFTSAYGHYRPVQSPASSTSDSTIVFIVKLLYQALIPITLGGMLAYIVLDISFRARRKKTAQKNTAEQAAPISTPNESKE